MVNLNTDVRNQNFRFHSLDFLKFLLAVIIVFHHFQLDTNTKFSHLNFFGGWIYLRSVRLQLI